MSRPEVIQPLDTSFRLIPLTQDQIAFVDAADFDWLSKFNWFAIKTTHCKTFYAARMNDNRMVWMHREILNCSPDKQCDHRNRNTLDNRRENLREASPIQNVRNHGAWRNNRSGHKGVTWYAPTGKWAARIGYEHSIISLGHFSSIEEAAHAYDEAAKKYHGEFAG